ncbi:MAG: cysteine--tRNA ligase [Patescibacteria group bacterium]
MKLYNSLSKKLEDFRPNDPDNVKIYACGPTVYNDLQIGNLTAFIYADLLVRLLRDLGLNVDAVMNITDVDDKMIRDSQTQYPDHEPMDALKSLADKYTAVFLDDMTKIHATSFRHVSATDHIDDMLRLVTDLLDKNLAYVADDGVYFSISEYSSAGNIYGRLTNIDPDASRSRIHDDEYDGAGDFALWKLAKPNEPSWGFNYEGRDLTGRPGWHIECSAMIEASLGTPIDIHTGGIDLKFPHHENEIAQSSILCSGCMSTIFFHNEHLLVDGQKMSKSKGNFYTLRQIEDKGYDPTVFRLVVIQSHYRSTLDFSWDALDAAQTRLDRWRKASDLRWQVQPGEPDTDDQNITYEITDRFAEHLFNDLDTPKALAEIEKLFSLIDKDGMKSGYHQMFQRTLERFRDIFGIDLLRDDITDEQKELVAKRRIARGEKDWTASDQIRDQLASQGITLNDGPHGQTWSRAI